MATASLEDKTYGNQRTAAAILETVFAAQPNHPGVAHYLIHAYDNPELAPQGLVAARAYSKNCPPMFRTRCTCLRTFLRGWDSGKIRYRRILRSRSRGAPA